MFTTPIQIPSFDYKIDYNKRGLIIGSCFAEHIGQRLVKVRMPVVHNPCGIMFNPASIAHTFLNIVQQRQFTAQELVYHNGLWHSMHHHGSFSDVNQQMVLDNINRAFNAEYDYIIVTLGTAWVYQWAGEVVANCHKLPATYFQRRRLSVEECLDSLRPLAQSGAHIIVTISPVRHIKDGLTENCVSKSVLRLAADELCAQYDNVSYFPSYEIMMDELRDYRYYADDMLHPSNVAVDYIWKRFIQTCFTDIAQDLVKRIESLNRDKEHRPLHPESDEFLKFQQSIRRKEEHIDNELTSALAGTKVSSTKQGINI